MFTVAEVAERYGVKDQTVLQWIHAGELKAFTVGRTRHAGKPRWRTSAAALAAFEAARTPTPPPQQARRRGRRSADVIEFYTET